MRLYLCTMECLQEKGRFLVRVVGGDGGRPKILNGRCSAESDGWASPRALGLITQPKKPWKAESSAQCIVLQVSIYGRTSLPYVWKTCASHLEPRPKWHHYLKRLTHQTLRLRDRSTRTISCQPVNKQVKTLSASGKKSIPP